MIVGIDMSLRNVAIASHTGYIIYSGKTGLHLNSPTIDIFSKAKHIRHILEEYEVETCYVDYTKYPFKAHRGQEKLTGLFIGACVCTVPNVILVEPATLRKVLGLKTRASKNICWDAFSIEEPGLLSDSHNEHEKDAILLAVLGKKYLSIM
jgi:hypothetical protein